MPLPTIEQLNNVELDSKTIADVANSPLLYTVNRVGKPLTTLAGFNDKIESSLLKIGYLEPVSYSAGIEVISSNQTIEYNSVIYAPLIKELPFETSGVFESSKFYVIQGVTNVELKFDIAKQPTNNNSLKGLVGRQCSLVLLGDSISEAVGASSYIKGCSYMAMRSAMNFEDKGWPNNRGFGYHSIVNMANCVQAGNITTNGSIIDAGIVGSRLSLAPGQTLSLSKVSVDFSDIVYDASASSGNIEISLNGGVYKNLAITGVGLKDTFPTQVSSASGHLTNEGDVITFKAVGGTVVLCAIMAWRKSEKATAAWVIAKSGSAYQDYASATQLDELSYWLNKYRSDDSKTLILNLGTNNIYSATKALSPSDTVATIGQIVNGILARCTKMTFAIAVPPKATDEWPVILPGVTYEDYANSIIAFARENGHSIIRHDRSQLGLGSPSLYSDGVHPNDYGHAIAASNICETLGVPLDDSFKSSNNYNSPPSELSYFVNGATLDVGMSNTWGPFIGNSNFRGCSTRYGNVVTLSGVISPNGSLSSDAGVLSAGHRPIGRNVSIFGRTNAGITNVDISSEGVISVNPIPSTWISLDGMTFVVERT